MKSGHSSGDTFVVFPALRTMHAGDMFAWRALPYIDPMNGGSVVVEHPQSIATRAWHANKTGERTYFFGITNDRLFEKNGRTFSSNRSLTRFVWSPSYVSNVCFTPKSVMI